MPAMESRNPAAAPLTMTVSQRLGCIGQGGSAGL
jgi:hypothetical protein